MRLFRPLCVCRECGAAWPPEERRSFACPRCGSGEVDVPQRGASRSRFVVLCIVAALGFFILGLQWLSSGIVDSEPPQAGPRRAAPSKRRERQRVVIELRDPQPEPKADGDDEPALPVRRRRLDGDESVRVAAVRSDIPVEERREIYREYWTGIETVLRETEKQVALSNLTYDRLLATLERKFVDELLAEHQIDLEQLDAIRREGDRRRWPIEAGQPASVATPARPAAPAAHARSAAAAAPDPANVGEASALEPGLGGTFPGDATIPGEPGSGEPKPPADKTAAHDVKKAPKKAPTRQKTPEEEKEAAERRARLFLQLANHYRYTDSVRAIEYAKKVIELSPDSDAAKEADALIKDILRK